jgi:hypothetical protein
MISSYPISVLPFLALKIADSFIKLAKSAPENPKHLLAISFRSTSAANFFPLA